MTDTQQEMSQNGHWTEHARWPRAVAHVLQTLPGDGRDRSNVGTGGRGVAI